MEGRLKERLESAERALRHLQELAAKQERSEVERDAMIHRFEFTFELAWKAAKEYLREEEGIDAASPKKVIRICREIGMMTEEQTEQMLLMADDRNLTAHAYDEEMAERIAERIRGHAELLGIWLEKMKRVDV